ncbi:MAG: hypothetical protein ABFS28_17295 [Bacteroidota bacterium]
MNSITISRSLVAMLFVVLASSFSYNAPANKFSPVGTWEYSIEGVPEGYDTGSMIIVKNGKNYGVIMALNEYYKIEGESVEYKKKNLSFIVWVESEEVSVSGTFDRDKFTGMVSLSQGDFEVIATRNAE